MRSSSGLTDKILLVSQNKLTRLLKSGTNPDELLKAVDMTIMGELMLWVPQMFRYTLNLPTSEDPNHPHEQIQLKKEDAHDWLDTILDTEVRPLMHKLLNFYYLSDVDGESLYQKEQVRKNYSLLTEVMATIIRKSMLSLSRISDKIE